VQCVHKFQTNNVARARITVFCNAVSIVPCPCHRNVNNKKTGNGVGVPARNMSPLRVQSLRNYITVFTTARRSALT